MSYNYTLLANDTYQIAGGPCGDLVNGVLTIPNTYNGKNITKISSFTNCSGIIEVVMPNTITGIDNASFYSCRNLKKITFSNNLTSIGANAFVACTGLSSMELPNSLVFIGNNAFFSCFSLTGVSIPSGVTLIRQQTFSNCTGLKMISMSDNITGIEFGAFSDCRNLNDFKFSNNLKYIDGSAFQQNVNLKSVILPDTLNKLGLFSFASCSGINNFILSKSLTGISSFLLAGNNSLKNIKIPSNIKNIESYGLYSILNLENIYFEGNFPTTGDSSIGLNSPNLKLYRKKNFTTGWPSSVQGGSVVLWSDNVIKSGGTGKLIGKKRPNFIYTLQSVNQINNPSEIISQGLKFYITEQTLTITQRYSGVEYSPIVANVYYDETNTYALWAIRASPGIGLNWVITPIDRVGLYNWNTGLGLGNKYYRRASDNPIGSYTGGFSFEGEWPYDQSNSWYGNSLTVLELI